MYKALFPNIQLQPYIDHYWLISGYLEQKEVINLMPDGSVTLLYNLGDVVRSGRFGEVASTEKRYLVGVMLQSDVQELKGVCRLFGIQFKPGAFPHFYKYASMDSMTNQIHEFQHTLFPDLDKLIRYSVPYLDQFFLDRLGAPRQSMLHVVSDIQQHLGQIRIDALAKRHCMTARQLERCFNQQVGVSPKEFINLTRFQNALGKIQHNPNRRSMSDIAWECGYYDHAHLTNDFKQYTGTAPTGLILSDFSKSIGSGTV